MFCYISSSESKGKPKSNSECGDKTKKECVDNKLINDFYVVEHNHEREKHDNDFCSSRDYLAGFFFGQFECLIDDVMDRVCKSKTEKSYRYTDKKAWEIGYEVL